jgi:hypothetical protein
MSHEHDKKDIELPHGAWFDPASGYISFTIERMTLSFTVEEFEEFVNSMNDIEEIIEQMIVIEREVCPTCGSSFETKIVEVPKDGDFN